MACAVPCVGTRNEAVPGIVSHGETGLLVPPGNPVALAAALEQLLSRPALAREMGARGRARVAALFRWEQVAERLERALLPAAGPRSGRRATPGRPLRR